ncbi:MAG: hypothetical protein KF847_08110 [Pirellulales bacterium]|nr:hypothetical protein [Pirellulales bacterium]
MRPILHHERKLICQLLPADSPPHANALPKQVISLHTGPDAALASPVVLNESFSAYFTDDSNRELSLVGCALGMPETIGNELMLVEDAITNDLVFLEFLGPSLAPSQCMVGPAMALTNNLQKAISQGATKSLVVDFESVFGGLTSHSAKEVKSLAYCRFLVIDSVVCFFLGTSEFFLSSHWDHVDSFDLMDGRCQHLSCGNEIAVEGWVEHY